MEEEGRPRGFFCLDSCSGKWGQCSLFDGRLVGCWVSGNLRYWDVRGLGNLKTWDLEIVILNN